MATFVGDIIGVGVLCGDSSSPDFNHFGVTPKVSKKRFEPSKGQYTFGRFRVNIAHCAFDLAEAPDYFEVLVSEVKKGTSYYVHLVRDPRFSFFSTLQAFDRTMRPEELIEFNSYFYRKDMEMPTWKLSRTTLLELVDQCKRA